MVTGNGSQGLRVNGVAGAFNWKLPHPAPRTAELMVTRPAPEFVKMTVCPGAGTPDTTGGPTCGRTVVNGANPVAGEKARAGPEGFTTAPFFSVSAQAGSTFVYVMSKAVC